jgi:FkbM family methyltransferase
MSDYFILTRPTDRDIGDDTKNQVVSIKERVYILPKINMTYYTENGLFEKSLIEWCKQFCEKDKNILDIGAHSGTYTISLADYCNRAYAFEPQKMTYYSLCGSVALSNLRNVECLNFGLGSEEQVGEQTLNIVSLDGGGSTLHADHTPILNKETIVVKTLDSFQIENVSFIKMDVENNELQVLMGSQNTLKRSNYPKILFEMNETNRELTGFLENIYYQIIPINGYSNMFLAVHTGVIEICG